MWIWPNGLAWAQGGPQKSARRGHAIRLDQIDAPFEGGVDRLDDSPCALERDLNRARGVSYEDHVEHIQGVLLGNRPILDQTPEDDFGF